jgi:murein DD-endopeptidase MepM/ murein hydrolase activator NlpD
MKPIKSGIVSFPYGAKYKSGGIHKGIDYRAAIGTPVVAAVPGVVVHAG